MTGETCVVGSSWGWFAVRPCFPAKIVSKDIIHFGSGVSKRNHEPWRMRFLMDCDRDMILEICVPIKKEVRAVRKRNGAVETNGNVQERRG